MLDPNYLKKDFIDQAKPALEWFDFRWGIGKYGLPEEYTRLSYVENSSSTRVDTGVYCAGDMEFYVRVRSGSLGSFYILQARPTSSGNICGISGSSSGGTITLGCGGQSVASSVNRVKGELFEIRATIIAGKSITLYVKNLTTGETDTVSKELTNIEESSTTIGIFGNGFNYVSSGQQVEAASLKQNGALVRNYIPVRNGDAVGFYDTVNKSFVGASNGTLIAGEDVAN